ncbi:hypothetical protein [Alkalihalobacillus pseudalcaliphilus]|uniref:hypothetical protein n=1 Tax=Alkalihalobacillus pseudalcaliphilus TaxID=79884 RepID=UPI000AB2EA1B|nr:hypothetical protein [Alkalihalobacillus pseudalcaliphilus]
MKVYLEAVCSSSKIAPGMGTRSPQAFSARNPEIRRLLGLSHAFFARNPVIPLLLAFPPATP